jgi:hypothetical protein
MSKEAEDIIVAYLIGYAVTTVSLKLTKKNK